MLLHGNSPVT